MCVRAAGECEGSRVYGSHGLCGANVTAERDIDTEDILFAGKKKY